MREFRTPGFVRGQLGNWLFYLDIDFRRNPIEPVPPYGLYKSRPAHHPYPGPLRKVSAPRHPIPPIIRHPRHQFRGKNRRADADRRSANHALKTIDRISPSETFRHHDPFPIRRNPKRRFRLMALSAASLTPLIRSSTGLVRSLRCLVRPRRLIRTLWRVLRTIQGVVLFWRFIASASIIRRWGWLGIRAWPP